MDIRKFGLTTFSYTFGAAHITNDTPEVTTSTFKSGYHKTKASLPISFLLPLTTLLFLCRLWHIYSSLWQTWRNHWVCRSIKSSDTPHRSYKQSKQNTSAIVKPYPSKAQMELRIPIKSNQWSGTDYLNALPPISARAVDDGCAKQ